MVFEDKVKGRIESSNSELDDLVIFRSDGWPTYNFAVVVDDIDMGITEVIRGDDHVNNTPRQINIYQALGAPVPEFAHLPMILGQGGQEALQAHRRGQRDGVPRRRLPAACAAQLPGAAGLVARRPGDLLARGDDRAVRHRRRQQGGLALRHSKSCPGSTSTTSRPTIRIELVPQFVWHLQRAGYRSRPAARRRST